MECVLNNNIVLVEAIGNQTRDWNIELGIYKEGDKYFFQCNWDNGDVGDMLFCIYPNDNIFSVMITFMSFIRCEWLNSPSKAKLSKNDIYMMMNTLIDKAKIYPSSESQISDYFVIHNDS